MKCVAGEKWRNPGERPIQTPISQPRNPNRMTETRTGDLSGGSKETNRLRHEALLVIINDNTIKNESHSCNVLIIFNDPVSFRVG